MSLPYSLRENLSVTPREFLEADGSGRIAKIFSWREHAAAQQLFPAAPPHFLRPIHPAPLAQPKKVPRVLVRRHAQVVQSEHHHARGPVRPVKRRLAGQREVRNPFAKPRTKIRPPQILRRFLPVHRGHPALGLQHLARAAIHLPANVERQFRFDAHRVLRRRDCPRPAGKRRRAVNRYSHTTKCSSLLTTSGLRTRFSTT